MFAVIFFGHIESIVNLPGAEIHWQDSSKGDPQEGNTGDEDRFFLTQLKCPSADEFKRKIWCIHTLEYYLAIKRNEVLTHAPTGMNRDITLSERSQTQKDKCVSLLIMKYLN